MNSKANLAQRQSSLTERLDRKWQPERTEPVMTAPHLRYEVSGRVEGIVAGGLGLILSLVETVGLRSALDRGVHVLKRHLPYHESDHLLAMVYNVLCGGQCLEDLERLRRDEGFLNGVGARRIPDPTTAGDFLRRFTEETVVDLIRTVQSVQARVWRLQPKSERRLAVIDVDGTIAPTDGCCKERMDISYDGQWGFAPLVVSLANTNEVLALVNRPANRPSHDGAAPWLDQAIGWAKDQAGFDKVRLRGDTDFSLTQNFDRWHKSGVEFVFGMDAQKALVERARELPESSWRPLDRQRPEAPAKPRKRPERVKDQVIRAREYQELTLEKEHVAEWIHRPNKSRQGYRLIVLRKTIKVEKGQLRLEDTVRYFFYITNIESLTPEQLVRENNRRCHQENLIAQLKNGVMGLRFPTKEFHANWAYMVIAALAWNLKAWAGKILPEALGARDLLRMEFRRFLADVILQPAQILKTGGQLIFRLLAINPWTRLLLEGTPKLKPWCPA
jgi:Transposase DDE domain group 1